MLGFYVCVEGLIIFFISEPETKMISMKTLISEIPKNSVIWNDVEKFFPRYEVVQISVTLADKGKEDNRVLNPTLERLIYADEMNEHLWNEAKKSIDKGKEVGGRVKFFCSIQVPFISSL